jgi:hypothetical protein
MESRDLIRVGSKRALSDRTLTSARGDSRGRRYGLGRVVAALVCGATFGLVWSGVADAAGSAKRRPTAATVRSAKPVYAICIEKRGNFWTIGDINALKSCKDKPGSIPVTF